MRTNVIAAAALLTLIATSQTPVLAQNDQRAQLQLTIVDETNAPVPNATVTVYTIHGPRTVNADAKGAVVIADLPAELTQVWARTRENLSAAEATKLNAGTNTQTLTLHAVQTRTEAVSSASGS
jgi:hypothetical protein